MPPRNKRKRAVKAEPLDSDSDVEAQGEPKRVKAEGDVKPEIQDVKVEELSDDDFVIELRNWEMSDVVSSDDGTERRPVRRSAGGRPPRRGVDVGRLYEEVGVGQMARSLGEVVKEEARVEAATGVKEEEGVEVEQRSPLRVSDYVRRAAAVRAEQLLQGTDGNETGRVSEDHAFGTSDTTDSRREEGRSQYGKRFTKEQRVALLDQFAKDPYPDRQTKEDLSRGLGVRYKSVYDWFQHERKRRGDRHPDKARARCRFGPEIYDELVAQYEADPNPDLATRRFLAKKADATVKQVSNWFENRRTTERRSGHRMQVTPKLRSELMAVFDVNPYPDRATKEALAEKVGCSVEQVSNWFSYRRIRKGTRESSEDYSRRRCQFGPEGYDKLMAQFEADPHADRAARAALAGQVGGTLRQITHWRTRFLTVLLDKNWRQWREERHLKLQAGSKIAEPVKAFVLKTVLRECRCVFSSKVYDELVAQFEADPHPDLATRRALAERTGATVKRISNWFDCRRRKERQRKVEP